MSQIRIAPIVEGHGEVAAVPILLRRIWIEMLAGSHVEVLKPIRQKKDRLVSEATGVLANAVQLAARKLGDASTLQMPEMILVIIDADHDLPCELGPKLLQVAKAARADRDIACVIANVEYESWLIAGSSTLLHYLRLDADDPASTKTEQGHIGKSWVEKRFKGPKYSETIDQPKMTSALNLLQCREN